MNGYDLELFNRFLDALKEVNIEWKLTELDGDFNYTAIVKEKEISITLKSSNVIIFEIAKQFSHVISQGNPLQKKILDLVGHTEYYCEFNSEAVNYMLSIVNQNKELSEDDIAILSNFFKIKKYEYQNKLLVKRGRSYESYSFKDEDYKFEVILSESNRGIIRLKITDDKLITCDYNVSKNDMELYMAILSFIDRKDILYSFPYWLSKYFIRIVG